MSCGSLPSGLLGSEGPPLSCAKNYGIQWINIPLGQVGTSTCLPWKGQVWHFPLQHCWSVASSLVLLGMPSRAMTPLCFPLSECEVTPSWGEGPYSWAPLHSRRWVLTASDQKLFHYTLKTSPPLHPLVCRVCLSLAADSPEAVVSTPKVLGLIPLEWILPQPRPESLCLISINVQCRIPFKVWWS